MRRRLGAPDSLSPGSFAPGQTKDLNVTACNTGNMGLASISASITGTDAGQFSLISTPPASLADPEAEGDQRADDERGGREQAPARQVELARQLGGVVAGQRVVVLDVGPLDGPLVDDTDPRDDARARSLAIVSIVGHEQTELDEARAVVAEPCHALARRELSLAVLALDPVRPAALAEPLLEHAELGAQLPQATGTHDEITLPAPTVR